jgi:hypothetical protein
MFTSLNMDLMGDRCKQNQEEISDLILELMPSILSFLLFKLILIPLLKFMCFCVVKLKLITGRVGNNHIEMSCNFSFLCLFSLLSVT